MRSGSKQKVCNNHDLHFTCSHHFFQQTLQSVAGCAVYICTVQHDISAKYSKTVSAPMTTVACLAFRRDRNMRGRLQKLHFCEAVRLCADAAL